MPRARPIPPVPRANAPIAVRTCRLPCAGRARPAQEHLPRQRPAPPIFLPAGHPFPDRQSAAATSRFARAALPASPLPAEPLRLLPATAPRPRSADVPTMPSNFPSPSCCPDPPPCDTTPRPAQGLAESPGRTDSCTRADFPHSSFLVPPPCSTTSPPAQNPLPRPVHADTNNRYFPARLDCLARQPCNTSQETARNLVLRTTPIAPCRLDGSARSSSHVPRRVCTTPALFRNPARLRIRADKNNRPLLPRPARPAPRLCETIPGPARSPAARPCQSRTASPGCIAPARCLALPPSGTKSSPGHRTAAHPGLARTSCLNRSPLLQVLGPPPSRTRPVPCRNPAARLGRDSSDSPA